MAEQSIYATPSANVATRAELREYPGLRRLPYLGWGLALQVLYFAMALAMAESPMLGSFFLVMMVGGSGYLVVQRLRNIGSSPWWAVGMIVPLLNIYVGLKATAFPEGFDDHKQFDAPAKIVIGLFLGVLVIGIGGAVLIPVLAT
jgi:uncharacterized membrane protein YhaH (DUF805 family)